ncbi:oligosaccharide flippase family protein [Nocardioides sp. J2M5]|uniref:oligosaccharide flippase family protein n=1 Tax=Nocardioides palaemonis TaxID=2829810 RepID=UPI001BAAE3AC|nr:oligosaccharide flippase family protein [Nocardioides palaemonis]MBS2938220.1 oligosaccharide flippase family protein [Nocardioides palaemonis]
MPFVTAPSSAATRRTFDGGAVAVATSVMNVATYGYTMVTARLVGPKEYGAFVACLGLTLVVQVVAYGLQAAAARRIAVDGANVAAIERVVLALGAKVSVLVGVVLLAASPLVGLLLNLDDPVLAALVGLAAVPLTFAGAQAGVLQGEKRWGALAAFYLASGLPRLVIGTGIVVWRPDATSAFLGVVVGLCFPVAAGWWVLRGRRTGPTPPDTEHSARAVLVEAAHNMQALLAFYALSSVDIILARQVLTEHDAGLYAAGLIVTKVMLFLPQFVVVLAFPDMATADGRNRALVRSLAVVGGVGVVAVAGAKVLSGVAMVFVGGERFAEVEGSLWVFAVLGTVLAMLQLQVYAAIARQGRRAVVLVWAALVVAVLVGLRATTLVELVATVAAVDAVLLLALGLLGSWAGRRTATTATVPVR